MAAESAAVRVVVADAAAVAKERGEEEEVAGRGRGDDAIAASADAERGDDAIAASVDAERSDDAVARLLRQLGSPPAALPGASGDAGRAGARADDPNARAYQDFMQRNASVAATAIAGRGGRS